MARDLSSYSPALLSSYTRACNSRMETMRGYRIPWWAYWAALAEMYFPQKYRWFVTPNNYSRGAPLNQAIVDETGVIAARTLATGLLAGLTSPTRPWFRLGLEGMEDLPDGAAKNWLNECTERMFRVYSQSNFYDTLGTVYHQLGVFGSAALIQYEDTDDVIRFFNPVCGEYFFALDRCLRVDTLYREFTYTVAEAVDEFGLENLSPSTQAMAKSPSSLDSEIVFGHAIEPNGPVYEAGAALPPLLPPSFKYREVFWEKTGASGSQQLQATVRVAGYRECPFVGLRWDVTSNDAYGRSPGMDALPAVRQLQIEQRRKAEAIDKMVRPPMVAHVSMKNEPMDTLPGGVTFSADPQNSGFKPAYTVQPQINELMLDLQEVQARVKTIFFNDLFIRFMEESKVQTATWVDATREEKLILVGPVIERLQGEGLDEIIERTFEIMQRRKLFPPPPPEIQGHPISISYISMLAEAQRATATAAIERLYQFAAGLVAVKPDVMDNLEADLTIEKYADLLNVDPEIVAPLKKVLALRQARAQQQQAQAAMQVGAQAAQGAQVLSQTDVGGGQNALQQILGNQAA